MSQKLETLCEVNKKINDIQKVFKIKMNSEDGVFDFIFPSNGNVLSNNKELGEGNLYKKLKFYNFDNKNINSILFYGKKDSFIKNHNHEESQLFVCIEGKIKFFIDEEEIVITKGESLLVNSFQWHQYKIMESAKIIIIYNV